MIALSTGCTKKRPATSEPTITKTNLFAGDTIGSQYKDVSGDPTSLQWTSPMSSDWDGITALLIDGEQPTTPTSTPDQGTAMVEAMVSSTWGLIAGVWPVLQWLMGLFIALLVVTGVIYWWYNSLRRF